MQRILSFIFIAIGTMFLYIFTMTFIGALDGGRYLILEIILLGIWGIGMLLFLIVGITMFKSDIKRRRSLKDDEGAE